MPFLAPVLPFLASLATPAGLAGAGGALEGAGGAALSGAESLFGGGGEAGQIASLGQEVPSGVSFEGPTSAMSPAESSLMLGDKPFTATGGSDFVKQGASIGGPSTLGSIAKSPLLGPLGSILGGLLSGGGGGGQQPAGPSFPTPPNLSSEPGGIPALAPDRMAFLRLFQQQA